MSSIVEFAKPEEAPSAGLTVGVASTPVGLATLVWDVWGLREFSFNAALADILAHWPSESVARDDGQAAHLASEAFAGRSLSLPLVFCGTEFQRGVWRALMVIKAGQTVSYGELAQRLGKPRAARAIGSAVGANRLGFVVPCHRVIRQDGVIGQFRWGSKVKERLLAWESEAKHG